ncbi:MULTISPECIES: hypothetical protein [unclassified Mycobacterium]|uniref:hypothetical protein n=1 Tax=unclassified Mycobacterium TaxID=2642494 RepID=UPI0007404C6F|nr:MULTISPECIES: hypothetical protein [unclassified Mycobacterium]KUH86099.1 hypothetical protein AU187_04640 [Mycobacterium sp. IS-1556]KUH86977.1 hypothetical protein AU185_20715 [Mycobacterium sp. GA-0227b]KUH92254.1 hypothetical protein AU186_07430 [Mycobacterium sp. GA-1999]
MTVTRDVVASIAVAGALAAAAVASPATAGAEPPPAPPVGPAVPAPPPAPPGPLAPMVGMPLAQNGSLMPALPADPSQYLLGQNPLPSAPGGPPATPPNLRFPNNAYLLPQYMEPSAPGEGTMFDVAPGAENANISDFDYMRRLWHLYQGGYLKGSLLGQMPQDQLGAPLPGTAPPPGTNIPPGLTLSGPQGPPVPHEAVPPAPPPPLP